MDEKELLIILQKFGFSEREALVYRATLKIGEASVTQISSEAVIARTHCYDILRTLEEKGAITSLTRNARLRYTAVNPRQLQRIFQERLKTFEEYLPAWDVLYQQAPNQPKVRFFTGKDGLENIHQEFLVEAKEILFFGSGEDWMQNFSDYKAFTNRLIRHHITIREITKESPLTKDYGTLYKEGRHEMRFAHPDWNIPSDMMIWGNKVALATYGAPDMYGVVIESAQISTMLRQMFEVVWGVCGK